MPSGPWMFPVFAASVPRPGVNQGRKRGVTKPASRKPRRNRRKP